ncbi:PREDICTED: uncharacterized protein LOC109216355 [Nicotiana attenuata]|uniref:uncharacterized protein LOC109216355 n=1 Tax=Nicotiana attenuata TaxID=49451 RepID=UPI0009050968|nr:PREDICTED: uncharacterized protein LOC109216355 [Nicotiana attenuata]
MTMSGERSLFMVYVVFLLVSFSVIQINHALELAKEGGSIQERTLIPKQIYIITPARKLLNLPEKRIGPTSCSKDNILVNQGPSGTLPNGIPTYTAIVENVLSRQEVVASPTFT